MRVLAIRGQNIASLADSFEVDLAAEPIASSRLFAIVGPTGSGKSTLLDTLCLALFHRTPRLGGRSGSNKVGGRKEELRIGSHDVRGLLHRGATSGFAECDFEGQSGKRYRARWSVRRAGGRDDGRLQQPTYSLIDLESGSAIGRTKGEVAKGIVERLGLTFEQFRRSVLLAQGDFAAFLKASNDERAALLERMTATPIYAELSVAAHQTARDKRNALTARSAARDALVPMDGDQRRDLQRHLSAAIDTERGAAARMEAAHHLSRVLERDRELFRGISDAAAAQREAEVRCTAAAPRKEALALASRSEAFREAVVAHDAQAEELKLEHQRIHETQARTRRLKEASRISGLALDAIRAQLRLMQAGSADFEQQIEEAHALDIALGHNSASRDSKAKAAEAAQATMDLGKRDLKDLGEAHGLCQRTLLAERSWIAARPYRHSLQDTQQLLLAVNDLAQTNTKIEVTALRLTPEREAKAAADRLSVEAVAGLEAARTLRSDLDDSIDSGQSEDLRKLHDHKQQLETRASLIQRWSSATVALATAQTQHQQAARAGRVANDVYIDTRASLESAERRVQENEEALDMLRAQQHRESRERAAAMLRAQLNEGDDCPVCGSETHSLPLTEPSEGPGVEGALTLLENRAEQDQRFCREQRTIAASKQALAAAAEAHERAVQSRLAELVADSLALEKLGLEKLGLEQNVREQMDHAKSPVDDDTIDAIRARIDRDLNAVSARIMEVFQEESQLTNLRKARKGANAAVDRATAQVTKCTDQQREQHASLQALEQEHDVLVTKRATLTGFVEKHAGLGWQKTSFAVSVQEDAQILERRLHDIETLTTTVFAQDVRIAERTADVARHVESQKLAEAALQGIELERAALRKERANALPGSVAEARKSRAKQDTLLRAKMEAAERESRDAERASSNAGVVATTLAASICEKQDKYDLAHKSLVARLSAAHLSFGIVRSILASEQSLASEEAALEQLEQTAAITRAEQRQRRSDWEKWRRGNAPLFFGLESAERDLDLFIVACSVSAFPRAQKALSTLTEQAALTEHADLAEKAELTELEPNPTGTRLPIQQGLFDRLFEEEKQAERDAERSAATGCAIEFKVYVHSILPQYKARAPNSEEESVWNTRAQGWMEEAETALQDARDSRADIRAQERHDNKQRSEWAVLNAALKDDEAELEVWEELSALIGSGDGKVFRGFAQSVTLDILLGQANIQLSKLYPRYGLERAPGTDLGLQVIDHDMGAVVRSVDTLSGGESFVVSLALALALANLSAQRTPLRTLFIDEGFGALDQDSLETVLDVLDTVQASGKQIGIISHIPEIAERFRVRVVVQSRHDGQSTVRTEPSSKPQTQQQSSASQSEFELK